MTIGHVYSDKIKDIYDRLDKLGQEIDCHDGKFDAYDLLDNAEEIHKLLSKYLDLKTMAEI